MMTRHQTRFDRIPQDPDTAETAEWIEALESLTHHDGPERAHFVMIAVLDPARRLGVTTRGLPYSA
ncbi:hypothetical protein [Mameliella alba]|uniref:hypothetical protein n=2 Tax=Mameliella alba TaxID=561184 RepID=UPI003570DE4E